MTKNVIKELQKRGFVDQITSEELIQLADKPLKFYIGFDPTADSLHVGNLVGIIALEWFRRFGHTPYALIGGATGRIGDPSGKSIERPLLEEATVTQNVLSIGNFLKQLFMRTGKGQITIINNDDWLKEMRFIDFLRDVGKHFRLSIMLSKESVKTRLHSEEGMSFTEFSYQILQAYDFYHLFKSEGIALQLGGSDQWGNITAGIELTRKLTTSTIYGMTFPLLTRSDGKKLGKSEEGAVWLSSDKLSPYKFYQYFIKIADSDVIKLLKMLTFLSLEEIAEYEQNLTANPNAAQKKLASEVTRFVHGEEGLKTALAVTEGLAPGAKATTLESSAWKELYSDMPSYKLSKDEVIDQKFSDVAVKIGLVSSKSEGTRLIQGGGAYVNNQKIEDIAFRFSEKDLVDNAFILVAAGKKKKMVIQVSS